MLGLYGFDFLNVFYLFGIISIGVRLVELILFEAFGDRGTVGGANWVIMEGIVVRLTLG
jgi:hypothetical protein